MGLEQFSLVHDRGSSHGATRIIRLAYYEHPDYVPLLRRAYERWYELEQDVGARLLVECGVLSVGRPDSELIAGIEDSAARHRLAIERYDTAGIRAAWPQFTPADDAVGILERTAGYLHVGDCIRAHQEVAKRHGAVLRAGEPVLDWRVEGGGVKVRTWRGEYSAARLIVTAGAWTKRLFDDLALPLTVMRQVALWFGTARPHDFTRQKFPCYFFSSPEGDYYGFPIIDERGAKLARHYGANEVTGPDDVVRELNEHDETQLRDFTRGRVPALDGHVRHGSVCMYTLTPDRHFLIDRHPAHPQVTFAGGFSGHGYKFASVVGEILADLSLTGSTTLPIEMFRYGRFAKP
ncbi:MAG: N-methyl-L-tryptophan oxidase [Pirellulales bacterium]